MAGKIIKGEDITLLIRLTDKNKNPIDLTGKTVVVKTKIAGVLTTFSSPDVFVSSPLHGEITMKMDDATTESLSVGKFDIDVYIDPAGTDTKIVKIYKQAVVEDRLR